MGCVSGSRCLFCGVVCFPVFFFALVRSVLPWCSGGWCVGGWFRLFFFGFRVLGALALVVLCVVFWLCWVFVLVLFFVCVGVFCFFGLGLSVFFSRFVAFAGFWFLALVFFGWSGFFLVGCFVVVCFRFGVVLVCVLGGFVGWLWICFCLVWVGLVLFLFLVLFFWGLLGFFFGGWLGVVFFFFVGWVAFLWVGLGMVGAGFVGCGGFLFFSFSCLLVCLFFRWYVLSCLSFRALFGSFFFCFVCLVFVRLVVCVFFVGVSGVFWGFVAVFFFGLGRVGAFCFWGFWV